MLAKMGMPHIIAVPLPAEGHVIPLLEVSQCLVREGIKVTFVNTDFNHERILNSLADKDRLGNKISLVSIPDGLEPGEDRNEVGQLFLAMFKVMPRKLEELIERINNSGEDEKVTCVLADESFGWAFEVAEKLGIPRAAFCPASAAFHSMVLSVPKLLENGMINENGTPVKTEKFQLAPRMPFMKPAYLVWACIGDLTTQKIMFNAMVDNSRNVKLADWIICNSAYDLEAGAFAYSPDVLPIGPLLASNRLGHAMGNFWPEDSTCLKWLDQQSPNSVIYVAFGSLTVLDQTQFQELAVGLELSDRPFLWVVRPDLTGGTSDACPEDFQRRVDSKGRLVGWVPQQNVLSHPSIACFVSHCGWNSTMEGVCNGVPFLCWPYFADQFLNESYICDIWKVGLRFNRNENGIITREEIKNKVEQIVGDQGYKARALEIREIAMMSVSEDGQSCKNFKNFIEWVKAHANFKTG